MIVLNDDTRCQDEARTWHQSTLSSLAGDASHSTDQLEGRVHGQVRPATISSKVSPENKVEPQIRLSILILSKTYPTMGILSPLSRHARLLAWGGCFAEKATKSRSLILDFSLQNSSSINHSKWASIQCHTWWEQLYFSNNIDHCWHHFLTRAKEGDFGEEKMADSKETKRCTE